MAARPEDGLKLAGQRLPRSGALSVQSFGVHLGRFRGDGVGSRRRGTPRNEHEGMFNSKACCQGSHRFKGLMQAYKCALQEI